MNSNPPGFEFSDDHRIYHRISRSHPSARRQTWNPLTCTMVNYKSEAPHQCKRPSMLFIRWNTRFNEDETATTKAGRKWYNPATPFMKTSKSILSISWVVISNQLIPLKMPPDQWGQTGGSTKQRNAVPTRRPKWHME